MQRNSSRPAPLRLSIAVAAAFAAMLPAAHAQQSTDSAQPETDGVDLGSWTNLLTAPVDEDNAPSIASAHFIEGSPETELTLTGEAEVRRAGTVITGEKIVYTQATGVVTTEGNASVSRNGAKFTGPAFSYNLDDETGGAQNIEYNYGPRGLQGEAGCARFQSADVTEFEDVVVTSCKKDNRSWWVEMDTLTLDEYEESGEGTGAVLKLGGVPVFGSPWFTFPLSGKRKSGLLSPTLGFNSERGFDLAIPYYFNLAPNYDYTLAPRFLSKRGIVLGNEFRIKQESFEAEVNLNYMPHDRKLGEDRYSIQGKFSGHWNGFNYGVNYNQVSDDDFLDDFASSIRDNTEDILPQDYWLTYGTTYWTAALRVTKNQTINDNDKPYEREPQFTWGAYFADLYGFELNTKIDATRFVHPWEGRTNGNRFVFEQDVSYPLLGASWFVTPKVKLVGTRYDLDYDRNDTRDDSPSLTLPMYSLDTGLIFERNTSVGSRDILQTLEPRIFYSYTPYRDQTDIPVFDSTIADFNFAQLYSENVWSGYDRYAETNQVSGTITTRLIDDKTGLEWIRASIGQRYYFNDETTGWSGGRVDQPSKSDFLASIGARLTRFLQATAYGQWSWERSSMQKATVGFRWQPRPMSVVGLYYRYNWSDVENSRGYIDDYINQIDLSVQWPLTNRLYALARQNYSFYDNKFIESLVGFEYQADCWTLRAVAQRYTRDEEEEQTSFFLQLELTGLGSLGSSPLSELQRSIQGYQQTTPMPTTAGTYDYYY